MGYQHENHFNKHHADILHNNFSNWIKIRIPYLSIMQALSWNLNQLLKSTTNITAKICILITILNPQSIFMRVNYSKMCCLFITIELIKFNSRDNYLLLRLEQINLQPLLFRSNKFSPLFIISLRKREFSVCLYFPNTFICCRNNCLFHKHESCFNIFDPKNK